MVRIRFSAWLVSDYAHVFIPLSIVVVTLAFVTILNVLNFDSAGSLVT